MRHPLQKFATEKCCFCCNLDPDLTCYIIGIISVVLIGFSSLAILGFGRFILIITAVLLFITHVSAGIILVVGTCQDSCKLKVTYCWITFAAILLVLLGFIAFIFEAVTIYSTLNTEERIYYTTAAYIVLVFYLLFLAFWDVYTPCVVIGNLGVKEEDEEEGEGENSK